MENSELKKRVMRRVYIIYARNFVYENGFLVATLFIFVVLFFSVSLADIVRNTPKESLTSVSNYMLSAFNHTELAIKSLLGLLALCAARPLTSRVSLSLRQFQGLRRPSWTRGI